MPIIKLRYPRNEHQIIYVQLWRITDRNNIDIIYTFNKRKAWIINDRKIIRRILNHIIFTWYKGLKKIAKPQLEIPLGT